MSTLPTHNQLSSINHKQYTTIISILSFYASKIEQVRVFGSRATDNYRPNSDLDLVIYGSLNSEDIARLWSIFADSNLPFSVDIQSYNLIAYPPLKHHINNFSISLVTKDELISFRDRLSI